MSIKKQELILIWPLAPRLVAIEEASCPRRKEEKEVSWRCLFQFQVESCRVGAGRQAKGQSQSTDQRGETPLTQAGPEAEHHLLLGSSPPTFASLRARALPTAMAGQAKLLYIVVVDDNASSFRYTRSLLHSTLQLMGCKPRHAFEVSI